MKPRKANSVFPPRETFLRFVIFHALSRFTFALLSLKKLRALLLVYLNTVFLALSRISFALPNLRKLRELLVVYLNTNFHALSRLRFALLSLRKLRELLVVYLNTIFHALSRFSFALLFLRKVREVHLLYLNARFYSRYRDQPYLEKRSETGYPARVYYEIPRDRFRKIKLDSSGSLRWTIQKQNKTTRNSKQYWRELSLESGALTFSQGNNLYHRTLFCYFKKERSNNQTLTKYDFLLGRMLFYVLVDQV